MPGKGARTCLGLQSTGQSGFLYGPGGVHIGIGKWVQNLAVVAVETILLSVLFLAVDLPEMLWTRHIEGEIAKEITQIVG